LAVRVISRLREELQIEVGIRDLFAHPVLYLFAEQVVNLHLLQFAPEDIARAFKLMQRS
jgi:hypothetical protein